MVPLTFFFTNMRHKISKICYLFSIIVGLGLIYIVQFYCFDSADSGTGNANVRRDKKYSVPMATKTRKKPLDAYENMDLYLRMTTENSIFTKLYQGVLVQSMRYFWPVNVSMVVVLDHEREEDHVFGDNEIRKFPFPRVCYMTTSTIVKYSGKDRMQRDMFYPEKCTSKKYVGYIDTDTMFITRIIPHMLFVDGKPIIVGIYGNVSHNFWSFVSQSTAKIFKTKEVMRCMSYFPLILKVDHIIKLREYLTKLHNMSFDEILQKIRVRFISQFNLMCQYIWMFHRNEYKFHFQLQPKIVPNVSSEAREEPKYYEKLLTREETLPFARPSTHYKYVAGGWKNQNTYKRLFKASICFAGGFEQCPDKCKTFKKDSLRKEMFYFDYIDWTWDKRCLAAQKDHYRELAKYESSQYTDIIRKACNEVDNLTWTFSA